MISTRIEATLDTKPLDNYLRQADNLPFATTAGISYRILQIARRLSRVRTGEMKRGWTREKTGTGKDAGYIIYNDVEHTIYNEYGTVRMAAKPMLRPAIAQVSSLLPMALRKYILFAFSGNLSQSDPTGGGGIL